MITSGYSQLNEKLTSPEYLRVGDIFKDTDDKDYYKVIRIKHLDRHVELTTINQNDKQGSINLDYGTYDRVRVYSDHNCYWDVHCLLINPDDNTSDLSFRINCFSRSDAVDTAKSKVEKKYPKRLGYRVRNFSAEFKVG